MLRMFQLWLKIKNLPAVWACIIPTLLPQFSGLARIDHAYSDLILMIGGESIVAPAVSKCCILSQIPNSLWKIFPTGAGDHQYTFYFNIQSWCYQIFMDAYTLQPVNPSTLWSVRVVTLVQSLLGKELQSLHLPWLWVTYGWLDRLSQWIVYTLILVRRYGIWSHSWIQRYPTTCRLWAGSLGCCLRCCAEFRVFWIAVNLLCHRKLIIQNEIFQPG